MSEPAPAAVGAVVEVSDHRPFGVTSRGLQRRVFLPALLGAPLALCRSARDAGSIRGWVCWGRRPSARAAESLARATGLPLIRVEDGFVRSAGLGVDGAEPFGFVVDDAGIYYDASRPSALERAIETMAPLDADERARVERLRARLVAVGACKYNHTWDAPDLGPRAPGETRVLLVDQTRGDRGVELAGGGEAAFARMLAQARREHGDDRIIVLVHPDVRSGARRGYLSELDLAGCEVVAGSPNPYRILEQVDAVWVVSSQLGLEAMVAGLPVTCFAQPWFAGWGATRDLGPGVARRSARRDAVELIHAGYLGYSRYVDPLGRVPCQLETIVELLATQRRMLARAQERIGLGGDTIAVVGVRRWKRPVFRRFLSAVAPVVAFGAKPASGAAVVAWGGLGLARAGIDPAAATIVEDGFLRSVGLGSDKVPPLSLILDPLGIYYDATRPSALERHLAEHAFDADELALGERLIGRLRATGLSKYNVGTAGSLDQRLPARDGRERILVPGQVAGDQSLRLGCPVVADDAGLLARVRADFPDAFLIYKPHPDVVAGNRRGGVAAAVARGLADAEVRDLGIDACYAAVDRVATLTSQSGFEALIRGLAVTTYGWPFYAGWGLTDDRHPGQRRGRELPLAALVQATLDWYPLYREPVSGLFIDAEAAITWLERQRREAPDPVRPSWRRRWWRLGLRVVHGLGLGRR